MLAELVVTTMPGDQIAAIQQFAAEGVIDQNLINKAASDAHVEPSVMEGQIETVRTAMLAQASAVVEKSGVNPDAVWQWANQHHRAALGEAVRAHAMNRSTTGYTNVARAYMEALPEHDPELILNSDFGGQGRAHRDPNTGKIIITTKGGHQFEWKAALKAGVVSLG